MLTHVSDSDSAERSWYLIHTDLGPVSLCLWYRPKETLLSDTRIFEEELDRFSKDCIGSIARSGISTCTISDG